MCLINLRKVHTHTHTVVNIASHLVILGVLSGSMDEDDSDDDELVFATPTVVTTSGTEGNC